ncbi:hypothetical protein AO369_0571 [Moraxella catarrhalis]|nr:hypothetical protein AO369_0571 [Moraxella catarrhalis]
MWLNDLATARHLITIIAKMIKKEVILFGKILVKHFFFGINLL